MALLSKKDANLILDPLADNNPITIQVLGFVLHWQLQRS